MTATPGHMTYILLLVLFLICRSGHDPVLSNRQDLIVSQRPEHQVHNNLATPLATPLTTPCTHMSRFWSRASNLSLGPDSFSRFVFFSSSELSAPSGISPSPTFTTGRDLCSSSSLSSRRPFLPRFFFFFDVLGSSSQNIMVT